jgi:DNA-binding NarL/FixJ family response regulator
MNIPDVGVPQDGSDAPTERISVAIVDDHAMVADGLARIVSSESDFELAGLASNVAEALSLIERQTPDVVLMDFHLPDGNGAEATEKVLQRWPDTKILMLSGSGANDLLARAIEAGCAGFLDKSRPASDVVAAVRAVSRGESVMRSDELAGLLGKLRSKSNGEGLSTRELGVLRLLATGRSSDAIASELFLSIHTVRNHVRNILMKLGAHSKLEAVAIAARDGIIGLEEIG